MRKKLIGVLVALVAVSALVLVAAGCEEKSEYTGGGGDYNGYVPRYVIPTGLMATFGSPLSGVLLPTNWTWSTPDILVGQVGQRSHRGRFSDGQGWVERLIVITVTAAVPPIPDSLTAAFGSMLSSVELPSGWVWNAPLTAVGTVGDHDHDATFIPLDDNFYMVVRALTVSVHRAAASPSVPLNLSADEYAVLSDVTLPDGWAWENPLDDAGLAGIRYHKATYTPQDLDNYEIYVRYLRIEVIAFCFFLQMRHTREVERRELLEFLKAGIYTSGASENDCPFVQQLDRLLARIKTERQLESLFSALGFANSFVNIGTNATVNVIVSAPYLSENQANQILAAVFHLTGTPATDIVVIAVANEA